MIGEGMGRCEAHAAPAGRPNMADLIRQGTATSTRRSSLKVQKMIASLSWRDKFSRSEFYPIEMCDKCFRVRQLRQGEVSGLGTGATVWAAAFCMLKYLEHRFGEGGLKGKSIVDIGSGTGATGIGAAVLGGEVVLTDQAHILDLTRENMVSCAAEINGAASGGDGSSGSSDTHIFHASKADSWAQEEVQVPVQVLVPVPVAGGGSMRVAELDWGDQEQARKVSECVLPKLYPLEPLVEAIDHLCALSEDAVVLVAYEYRCFNAFDPRTRFTELVTAKGFRLDEVPQEEIAERYRLDDVQIWELRRRIGD